MDKKKYLIDPREKLAHLIVSDLPKKDQKANATAAEKLANHLIAHGVTVQEWISVKDRLPDMEDVFLCWSKDLADMMFCYTSDFQQMEVTHWMPLPQPPKGE